MTITRLTTSILLICLLVGWPQRASADRVDRLIQILRTDSSYKVRMRVVITLSNIREPRVQAVLIDALSDRNHLVRGLSAKALAQLGARQALRRLRRMARKDRHHFVRKQAKKAVRQLTRRVVSVGRPRIYVRVGRLLNRTRNGGRRVVRVLRRALINEFERVPGVTTRWEGRPSAADLRRQKMKGFVISGTIQRLTRRRAGRNLEIQCRIRVELATYPGNSMKAFYRGEASMAVASRSTSQEFLHSLYREIFVGAAQEARTHIVRSYLSTQ